MVYVQSENAGGLDALTNATIASGDLMILGDVSDLNRAKAITVVNLDTYLAQTTKTLTNKTLILSAGTATAGTAPLKLTTGTLLGTTEAGTIEFASSHLYFTAADGGTRFQLDQQPGVATVTSVSVVTANGVSGSVATSTTTPAITLTLGAITPTTVNGLTIGLGGGAVVGNTALGVNALAVTSAAGGNTAVGYNTLDANTSGTSNTAVGASALTTNITGQSNTGVGDSVLLSSTGSRNTAIGNNALISVTGDGNVALGFFAGGYETGSNSFYVDNQNRTTTAGDKAGALLYGTFNATPASQTLKVNGVLSVSAVGTAAGSVASTDGTQTLTNKRIEPRVVSAASYTTDTGTSLSVATTDLFVITAQAGALLFNAPGGTPVQGQSLKIRIKDNGTARALTWNAVFRAMGVALPSITVLSKTLYLGFFYNSTDTKWDLVASAQEA